MAFRLYDPFLDMIFGVQNDAQPPHDGNRQYMAPPAGDGAYPVDDNEILAQNEGGQAVVYRPLEFIGGLYVNPRDVLFDPHMEGYFPLQLPLYVCPLRAVAPAPQPGAVPRVHTAAVVIPQVSPAIVACVSGPLVVPTVSAPVAVPVAQGSFGTHPPPATAAVIAVANIPVVVLNAAQVPGPLNFAAAAPVAPPTTLASQSNPTANPPARGSQQARQNAKNHIIHNPGVLQAVRFDLIMAVRDGDVKPPGSLQRLKESLYDNLEAKHRGIYEYSYSYGSLYYILSRTNHSVPDAALTQDSHVLESYCTSASTDITYLGDYCPTTIELLFFFPLHTRWCEVMWRLSNNGWTSNNIVRIILWSRGITNPGALSATTLWHQGRFTWKWARAMGRTSRNPSNKDPSPYDGNTDNSYIRYNFPDLLTGDPYARGGRRAFGGLEDPRLVDLAEGLKRWPQDEDRSVLTAAIELALVTCDDVRLSGFRQYVQDNEELSSMPWKRAHELRTHDRDAAQEFDENHDLIAAHMKRIGYLRK